ncbi:mechanosensitive ion channel family protein [Yinghuangia seranimata]|uniref:mechanosensitive ion channel family protein n=1 Tax=Yinghuangia seranimata TaxID=408067 RepID=UPI00248B6E3C|nr:mechanosensitive ion channel family protein [Yinghuangia seranimata]MDI2126207.1 mechanosensitive ion channel family protein [Yinghuangia seranimata]
MDVWEFLRPLIVLVAVLVLTGVISWLLAKVAREVQTRRPSSGPLWPMLRRSRASCVVTLATVLLLTAEPAADLPEHTRGSVRHILVLAVIGSCAWLAIHAANVLVNTSFERYAAVATDAGRVRRVRTQIDLIRRVAAAVVGVIAIAAMIMTFPAMRTIGTSLLASAGLIGVVAGLAAQSTLANLFAGLQIAFSDMVRIGDSVVVNKEMGTVEEITLTYLVVNTWDQRRIVMPVSYFTGRPFENWSRTDMRMTGTVYLHLDHATPIGELRDELHRILKGSGLWDQQGWSLYVTDTTPSTIVVRAVVTARDADDVWTLRCEVREKLLDFLRRKHPYALPRISTSTAPQGPDYGAEDEHRGHPAVDQTGEPQAPKRFVELAKRGDRGAGGSASPGDALAVPAQPKAPVDLTRR